MPRTLAFLAALVCGLSAHPPEDSEVPKATDPGARIELIARDPELVTPVGVAVDSRGEVLVVESQTHFRPDGYQGPPADRIRRYANTEAEARAEQPHSLDTFFEGTRYTMGLAFEADGSLIVATRSQIFRLRRDSEGKVLGREELITLETKGDYPHNGLAGLAIDIDGTIYFGMGENLGLPYRVAARDGSHVDGGGEGGNVFRMRPDGSDLERFATGFWNPFGLAFDAYGRLFCVDNDPDSRPPCRLLHVVEGGDYGFRFRNGRRGLHPFTSWNGELPGTLPMVGGTGEAPSAIALLGHEGGLPAFAVTSWGDHRVERHRLEPRGASFSARRDAPIVGGVMFRPVGAAVAPDGSLFVSDWVDRSYPIHGKGRLWRFVPGDAARSVIALNAKHIEAARTLAADRKGSAELLDWALDSARSNEERALAIRALEPDALARAFAKVLGERKGILVAAALRRGSAGAEAGDLTRLAQGELGPEAAAEALRRLPSGNGDAGQALRLALGEADPFLRQAARSVVTRILSAEAIRDWLQSPDTSSRARSELLVALRELDPKGEDDSIRVALADPDPLVRLTAVQWVAEENRPRLEDAIRTGMTAGPVSERLFIGYLIALQESRAPGAVHDSENMPASLLLELAGAAELPLGVRRMALRLVPTDLDDEAQGSLIALISAENPALRIEAVRALAQSTASVSSDRLRALAGDERQSALVRAEAVAALSAPDAKARGLLSDLVDHAPASVARQAARSLRALERTDAERDALKKRGLDSIADPTTHPWALDQAEAVAAEGGDPAEGQRIFYHPKGPGCFRCHRIEGRGGRVGPDLTVFGRESGRARVVTSLLKPNQEVSPQFTAWRMAMKDGTLHTGQMMGEQGDVLLISNESGELLRIVKDDIEEQQALDVSIMPQDLALQLTREEFRDLVAFLLNPEAAAVPTENSSASP